MIETYETGLVNVVGFRINGMIRRRVMEILVKKLLSALDRSGEMNVVVEMEKFRGVTPHALLTELRFIMPNFDKFKRKAVISDNRLIKTMMGRDDKIEVMGKAARRFGKSDANAAAQWAATGRAPGDIPPAADRKREVEADTPQP
ncbi:MAG: hypothetical protein Alpg2KO_01520 [Alphaproteobacteria bacterium]